MQKYGRLVAFFIDMFIVSMLTLAISGNYNFNPYYYDMEDALKEYESITPTVDDFKTEDDLSEYISLASNKLYAVEHSQVYVYGWYLIFYILYFVVFGYFTEGMTLGKKFAKLKIVKNDDSKVGFSNLLRRSITSGSSFYLGANILIIAKIIGVLLFSGEPSYLIFYCLTGIIAFIIEITNLFMFGFGKNNLCLNDYISGSKVVNAK